MKLYLLNVKTFCLHEGPFLSYPEIKRYEGYMRQEDKDLFIMGRYLIRKYVGMRKFDVSENGKLSIQGEKPFSLSHSYPYVALAVSEGAEIGVDVETTERLQNGQLSELLKKIKTSMPLSFYWCLNEACFKASGKGNFNPSESIEPLGEGKCLYRDETYYYGHVGLANAMIVVASKEPLGEVEVIEIANPFPGNLA